MNMPSIPCNAPFLVIPVFAGLLVVIPVWALAPAEDGHPHPATSQENIMDTATVDVTVFADGSPLAAATVSLDLNNNGVWDPDLDEPRDTTGASGEGVSFGGLVSIGDPNPGDGASGHEATWSPNRIMTGNLRGTVAAGEVHVDFLLPADLAGASLELFDLRGRRLAGTHGVGDLALGVPAGMPTGVYVMRLSAGSAAPATHRITSVGQRTRTILARRLTAAEAVAAGWAETASGLSSTGKHLTKGGQRMNIIVEHADHPVVFRPGVLVPGHNAFTVDMTPGHNFVYLPPGSFMMGSPVDEPGRFTDRETRHQVALTQGFWMSKDEVTEEWWSEVMDGPPTTSQRARSRVSWDMAVQFCNALSILEGLTPAYTIHGASGDVTWNRNADGYRLPTEAEWEYACRAGTTAAYNNGTNCLSSDTEANFWGDDIGQQDMGCMAGIYRGETIDVATFPANAWGLYDMLGNVWEWVWDGWRMDYENLDPVDPAHDAGPGDARTARGCSWHCFAFLCRSANRFNLQPDGFFLGVGLRPVKSAF